MVDILLKSFFLGGTATNEDYANRHFSPKIYNSITDTDNAAKIQIN